MVNLIEVNDLSPPVAEPADLGRRRDSIVPGLRSFPVAQHVAFYIQRKARILVLRILHPRMNVNDAFEGGG